MSKRPAFIALLIAEADFAGHAFGPESKQTELSVGLIDHYIGELIAGLKERDLYDKVNLIIMSDHGMSPSDPDKSIFLDDYLQPEAAEIIEISPVLMLNTRAEDDSSAYRLLEHAHPALTVYHHSNFPTSLHWDYGSRTPDILGLLAPGWTIYKRRQDFEAGKESFRAGVHGHKDSQSAQESVFLARGPAFRNAIKSEAFDNIHVYELLAYLLEIEPAPNDGSFEAIKHLVHTKTRPMIDGS